MRLFLAGQKVFGAAVLGLCLARGHEVVGVCSPAVDRLHDAAEVAAVPWMPAGTLNAETLPEGVDLIVAAHMTSSAGARGCARDSAGLAITRRCCRSTAGGTRSGWVLKMDDRITGGSIYWLSDNTDGGDIAAQDWCFVRSKDDAESLWRRELFPLASEAMLVRNKAGITTEGDTALTEAQAAQILADELGDTGALRREDEDADEQEPVPDPEAPL